MMKQAPRYLLVSIAVALLLLVPGGAARADEAPPQPLALEAENLLRDGNMEDQPYYWEYPNHFVAPYWMRWWLKNYVIPEYDDTRTARPHYEGSHAQTYFKWGPVYYAGIYQQVTGLTPCAPYRLTAYARNHSLSGVNPHARIGLDPQGRLLTPNQHIGEITSLPSGVVWSAEQTSLFVWEQLTVDAEPVGSSLTAIFSAHPVPPNDGRTYYYDSYWDAASLTASTYPSGRMPEPNSWTPSGFIYNVITSTVGTSLVIDWTTAAPASTQVWYSILPPTTPITPTGPYILYLPLVASIPTFTYATPFDPTPVTAHHVVISGLTSGDRLHVLLLSRRPLSGACVTEISGSLFAAIP